MEKLNTIMKDEISKGQRLTKELEEKASIIRKLEENIKGLNININGLTLQNNEIV